MSLSTKIVGLTKSFGFFNNPKTSSSNILLSKAITSNLAGYLVNLSQFQNMDDQEVYENVYAWTSEVGGAIDRKSSLVRQSIQGFYVKDVGEVLDDLEKDMLKEADNISEQIAMKDWFEAIDELLDMHGNVFIAIKPDSFTILPNKYCALIDDKSVVGSYTNKIMTDPKYLAFNELSKSEVDTKIYTKDQFVHIKYKNTPVFATDYLNRKSYGYYAVSPTNRAMLMVWWSRQIQIIDVLLRWKNIPREKYTIDTTMFNANLYTGSLDERKNKAKSDLESYSKSLADEFKDRTPDQGIIVPDTVGVDILESSVKYISSNDLLYQLNSGMTAALNMPRSVVDGTDSGSYASQLVISNNLASKVIQSAEKIKPVLLNIIKERLRRINKSYPVDKLDIKIELSLATNELEVWRQASVMASLGVFTETEVREKTGYAPLLDDQRSMLIKPESSKTTSQTLRDVNNGGGMTENPDYPVSESARESTMYDSINNKIKNEI